MQEGRVFGLDVMRATAILLVVFWHNADALSVLLGGARFGPVVDGVDLFFVLSGYLIGGILLKYAAMEGVPLWRRALDFWQRRWLRTLPNYYLFLVVNIALVYFGMANGVLNKNTWGYAFFLQNVWKPVDLFFWESWSLVVEEWYYLLFPVLFFAFMALLRWPARRVFLLVTLSLITCSTVLRLSMTGSVSSVHELEEGVRKLMITRLDALGIGMMAVWIATTFPSTWRRLRFAMLSVGLLGVFLNALTYGNEHLEYSRTWYFTLGPLAMAALLPALSSWRNTPLLGRPLVFISLVSYALYLVHQPVRSLFNPIYVSYAAHWGLLLYAAYWIVCLVASFLVHRLWERRFMRLRDHLGKRITGVAPSS